MKKLIAILLVVIALVVGLFLVVKKPAPPAPESDVTLPMPQKVTENVTPPSPRARALFQGPRPKLATPPELGEECATYVGKLREVDIAKLSAPLAAPEGLPKGEGCAKLPDALATQDAAYRDACLKPQTDAQTCLTALFFYRAALTEWLTRNTPVDQITDAGTLTDKLFARFTTDPAGAADVAERLLDLEPDLYPAAKAALLSRLMDAQKNAQGNPNDPRWKKTDDLFPKAERGGREDAAQLFELRMVKELMRNKSPDYPTMMKDSEDFTRANPQSGAGLYNQAMIAYRQGDKAAAGEYLAQSCAREPSPRCAQTAERIKKGETEPFRTNLSFSLDPNKYLR